MTLNKLVRQRPLLNRALSTYRGRIGKYLIYFRWGEVQSVYNFKLIQGVSSIDGAMMDITNTILPCIIRDFNSQFILPFFFYFCIIYFVPSHGGISKILPKQTHNKVKISENVSLSFLFIGFTFTFTFNTLKYT